MSCWTWSTMPSLSGAAAKPAYLCHQPGRGGWWDGLQKLLRLKRDVSTPVWWTQRKSILATFQTGRTLMELLRKLELMKSVSSCYPECGAREQLRWYVFRPDEAFF